MLQNRFSGLAAAYKLKSNGVRVTIFEAEGRAGGKIRSNSEEGFIWDEGANTMVNMIKNPCYFPHLFFLRINLGFSIYIFLKLHLQMKYVVTKYGLPRMAIWIFFFLKRHLQVKQIVCLSIRRMFDDSFIILMVVDL